MGEGGGRKWRGKEGRGVEKMYSSKKKPIKKRGGIPLPEKKAPEKILRLF